MKNITLLSILFLVSCTPKVIVKMGQTNTSSYQKLDANFVFIKEDTIEFEHFLGLLEVKDNGFSKNCSYDSIKTIMIKKAEALGANCLVVQNHKTPNGLSTCHRLEARMYWIDNPYDYEKIIYWSDSRQLKIRDFKGTTINRPFEAATFSAIGYFYKINPWNGQLDVEYKPILIVKNPILKGLNMN